MATIVRSTTLNLHMNPTNITLKPIFILMFALSFLKDLHADSPTSGFSAVSVGGGHTLALKTDGSLWAWGKNRFGQVGNGSRIDQATAVNIGSGFSAIDAGGSHSVALKLDGSVWTWGANFSGQLGLGSIDHQSQPLQVTIPAKLIAIAAGGSNQFYFEQGLGHTLALDDEGRVWAWGQNGHGQLGDGTIQNQNTPVMVGKGFSAICAGDRDSAALRQDGTLLVWGPNVAHPFGVCGKAFKGFLR